MSALNSLTPGTALPFDGEKSFKHTMAAYRFYDNDRVEFHELIDPLRQFVRQQVQEQEIGFVLLAQDWCKLSYPEHASKRDQAQLAQASNRGYEMTTVLAVNGNNGAPLAPVEVNLKTLHGILSTEPGEVKDLTHHDQVLRTMEACGQWDLGAEVIHVIDREVDSVGHYRAWNSGGHAFLVRGHEHRTVSYEGQKMSRRKVMDLHREQNYFEPAGEALYQGKPAKLWVSQACVLLAQPARTVVVQEDGSKKQVNIPGEPLTLQLIGVDVRNDQGDVLATWYLLTNVEPCRCSAQQIARFYYWRWKIESYFKLMKSHGHQLEQWQQETAPRILRRLLIASMACVTVWQLMADTSPPSTELKKVLVRLSGRQTKRTAPFTAPALLAGLRTLLAMLDCLELHSIDELKALAKSVNLPCALRPG